MTHRMSFLDLGFHEMMCILSYFELYVSKGNTTHDKHDKFRVGFGKKRGLGYDPLYSSDSYQLSKDVHIISLLDLYGKWGNVFKKTFLLFKNSKIRINRVITTEKQFIHYSLRDFESVMNLKNVSNLKFISIDYTFYGLKDSKLWEKTQLFTKFEYNTKTGINGNHSYIELIIKCAGIH